MSTKALTATLTGRAGREGANESFATIISSAGNAHASGLTMRLQSSGVGNWQALRRGFISYDPTSFPLPTGYIISGAVLTLTPGVIPTDTWTQSICVTNALMATPLVGVADADYQGTQSYRTEYANRVTLASMVNGTASTWTFNAAGVAYLTTQYGSGDPIQLGVRWSCDVDQTDPGGALATCDINLGSGASTFTITYRVGPGHGVIDLTTTLGNGADSATANLFSVEVFS